MRKKINEFKDLLDIGAQIYAEKPQLRIHSFEGIFIRVNTIFQNLS